MIEAFEKAGFNPEAVEKAKKEKEIEVIVNKKLKSYKHLLSDLLNITLEDANKTQNSLLALCYTNLVTTKPYLAPVLTSKTDKYLEKFKTGNIPAAARKFQYAVLKACAEMIAKVIYEPERFGDLHLKTKLLPILDCYVTAIEAINAGGFENTLRDYLEKKETKT